MWANPEPTFQRYTTKPQTLKFSSHTSALNFAGTAPMLHHTCEPTDPEPTFQRHTTNPQTPRFSSHTSLFWSLPEQLSILHRTCEPTHPEPTSQDTLQTSDPKIFISHIPVLNFAGTARHVTPRMWANPSCTNVPRYTTNDEWLNFANSSSSNLPRYTSQNFNFHRIGGKMLSLAIRHGRMKTCVQPSGQKWFSVSFSGLNYRRPTYCKNALKRCSLGWNPLASWFI